MTSMKCLSPAGPAVAAGPAVSAGPAGPAKISAGPAGLYIQIRPASSSLDMA